MGLSSQRQRSNVKMKLRETGLKSKLEFLTFLLDETRKILLDFTHENSQRATNQPGLNVSTKKPSEKPFKWAFWGTGPFVCADEDVTFLRELLAALSVSLFLRFRVLHRGWSRWTTTASPTRTSSCICCPEPARWDVLHVVPKLVIESQSPSTAFPTQDGN